MSPIHLALLTVARDGRTNIDNFGEDLRPIVADLISTGFITCMLDDSSHDTLWCHLTPIGSDRLFALNTNAQPAWSLYSWDSVEA